MSDTSKLRLVHRSDRPIGQERHGHGREEAHDALQPETVFAALHADRRRDCRAGRDDRNLVLRRRGTDLPHRARSNAPVTC